MGKNPASARRWLRAALLILTAVVPACVYAYLHSRVIVSSDTTTTLPMASDILAGNVWLNNWILGSNNFYFTEILAYCLGRLAGLSFRALIVWIPSLALGLTFSLFLAFLLPELARYKRVISYIIFALLFISVLIIVPFQSSYALINANSHNNLYALIAVCLLFVAAFQAGHIWPLPLLVLLGSLLYFSEGVTLMVLIGPLVLFGLLSAIGSRRPRPLLLTLSGALMYAGGKGISALFQHMGGLVTRGLPIHLLSPEDAAGRISDWADQFGVLLDAPLVSSRVTVYTTFAKCAAVLFAAGLVYGIVRFFRLSWRRQLLLLIALLNIGGCLFTDVAITHRYIVPAFYAGFLLLFLFICDAAEWAVTRALAPKALTVPEVSRPAALPGQFSFWRAAAGLLVSFCLTASVSYGADKCAEFASQPVLGGDEQHLADFILENNLGDGYANFWNASVIAYYADFDFQVYPVYTGTGSGTFIAYPELIRRDWYGETGIHYFVVHETEEGSREILQQVVSIAGEPDADYLFGDYELLWYDSDLSALLGNGLYDNVLTSDELLPASDSGLLQSDDGWLLSEGGSLAAYGESLAPGTWRFTFYGENVAESSIVITSDKLGELAVYTSDGSDTNTTASGSDSDEVTLTVSLPKAVEDITIKVRNTSGEDIILNRIETEKF